MGNTRSHKYMGVQKCKVIKKLKKALVRKNSNYTDFMKKKFKTLTGNDRKNSRDN